MASAAASSPRRAAPERDSASFVRALCSVGSCAGVCGFVWIPRGAHFYYVCVRNAMCPLPPERVALGWGAL
eukprot:6848631-Prymnesium_polylepis.1